MSKASNWNLRYIIHSVLHCAPHLAYAFHLCSSTLEGWLCVLHGLASHHVRIQWIDLMALLLRARQITVIVQL